MCALFCYAMPMCILSAYSFLFHVLPQVSLLSTMVQQDPKLHTLVVGDVLQTIFDDAVTDDGDHALKAWQTATGATRFDMDVCYRCPPDHIRLINQVLADQQV